MAPLRDDHSRAHDALSDVAARLRERADALESCDATGDGHLIRGVARPIRLSAIDAVTAAVLAERSAGASWETIAAALGLDSEFVREHYQPTEDLWLAGAVVTDVLR